MNYNKYKQAQIDDKTGISVIFTPGYYSRSCSKDYTRVLCKASKGNNCLNVRRKELICLAAYGLKPTLCRRVLSANYPEFLDIKEGAFDSFFARTITYYSCNKNQLKKITNNFVTVSENLIYKYEQELQEEHITENNVLNLNYSNDNLPTIKQIQSLLQGILDITQIRVPEKQNNKKLEQERQEILKTITDCKNPILLGKHFSRLMEIVTEQQNNNISDNKEKNTIYEAINDLKDSGIISSIYRWLSIYNK